MDCSSRSPDLVQPVAIKSAYIQIFEKARRLDCAEGGNDDVDRVFPQGAFQLGDVGNEGFGPERHLLAPSLDHIQVVLGQDRLQIKQALTQAGSSLGFASIAPEESSQAFATGGLFRGEGEIGQKAASPAAGNLNGFAGRGGQAKTSHQA